MSRLGRTLAAVLAVGALALPAVTVPAAPAAADTTVTLLGHGYGHGRGMGQWGAYGYAVEQGWSAGSILDHYYGGTTAGTVANQQIGVHLTALVGREGTWMSSTLPFSVGGVAVGAGSAARIVRTGDSWVMYTSYGGCGARDNFGPYALPANPVIATAADPGDDVFAMLHTCSTGTSYRGSLQFVADGASTRIINTVPVESYLRGVVPRESPASWGDAGGGRGMEALKAQAVAARSYALSENRSWYAKTCDSESCQVYRGAGQNGARLEDARTDRAIAATAGGVRLRSGAVVRTEFSSSTGGRTTGASFTNVVDVGDTKSPYQTWRTTLTGAQIQGKYPQIGTFAALRVTQRDGLGVQGGRVLQLQVVGTAGTATVTGDAFRIAMGLRSNWFFPLAQADSVSYVKLAHADVVYKTVAVGEWRDRYPLTWAEYQAEGYPAVSTMPSDYVRYPWSPTVYAVTFWPGDPLWTWSQLDYASWEKAGWPAPRNAGWVYGTQFWRTAADPTVYADSPDGGRHALTYAEWAAAGYPRVEVR